MSKAHGPPHPPGIDQRGHARYCSGRRLANVLHGPSSSHCKRPEPTLQLMCSRPLRRALEPLVLLDRRCVYSAFAQHVNMMPRMQHASERTSPPRVKAASTRQCAQLTTGVASQPRQDPLKLARCRSFLTYAARGCFSHSLRRPRKKMGQCSERRWTVDMTMSPGWRS